MEEEFRRRIREVIRGAVDDWMAFAGNTTEFFQSDILVDKIRALLPERSCSHTAAKGESAEIFFTQFVAACPLCKTQEENHELRATIDGLNSRIEKTEAALAGCLERKEELERAEFNAVADAKWEGR